MSPEQGDNEDDDEREELASRSIFAAGWFRAVLVLTVLAIVVVVSLPYLLNWFEPSPPPARTARPTESPRPTPGTTAPAVTPSTRASAPPAVATPPSPPKPAPSAPISSAPLSSPTAPKSLAEKAAPAPSPAKAVAEKPAAPSTAKPMEKPAAPGTATPIEKPAAPTRVAKVAESGSKPAAAPKANGAQAGEGSGYWIQLGLFKDVKNAENLAKALRNEGFPVEVARVNRAADGGKETAAQHEIFVAEAGVEKVNAALKGRGSAESAPGGVVVKPALSLQAAMTVSRQLTGEGLKVVIRPAAGGGTQTATYHLVRAGGYTDRARALAARDQLKGKSHDGFLTQGPAK